MLAEPLNIGRKSPPRKEAGSTPKQHFCSVPLLLVSERVITVELCEFMWTKQHLHKKITLNDVQTRPWAYEKKTRELMYMQDIFR